MGEDALAKMRQEGSILQPDAIAAAVIELIEDESRFGAIMTMTSKDGRKYVT